MGLLSLIFARAHACQKSDRHTTMYVIASPTLDGHCLRSGLVPGVVDRNWIDHGIPPEPLYGVPGT